MDTTWLGDQRDAVIVEGPDAATYLQSQASQDLRGLVAGESRWTFLLQPTGRVDVLARVTMLDDETFRLDTDAGFGPLLEARLNRFKIRVKATVAAVDDDSGSVAAGDDERIAAGWPGMGSEIIPGETIPAETGLADVAVSYTKGCYPGQELVERMDSRGVRRPAPPDGASPSTQRRGARAGAARRCGDRPHHLGRNNAGARLRKARDRRRGARLSSWRQRRP